MKYLIWSNEHGMWVGNGGTFTWIIGLAESYEEAHARQIAGRALDSGCLYPPHPDMVLVPAPNRSEPSTRNVPSLRVTRSPLAALSRDIGAAA